jgi:hypothetical protein
MRAWSCATGCLALLILSCGSSHPSSNSSGGAGSSGAGAPPGTTAGVTATGGASAGGGGAGGGGAGGGNAGGESNAGKASGGAPMMPPVKVSNCDGLAAPGVFEEITPAQVKAGIGMKMPDNQTQGGPFAMAVDPINLGTVYSGTLFQGVWKSTDCGATWAKIATGTNAADVNRGMNWTLAVDPQDANIVYTNSGYGSNGLFKSTDGGVNWTDVWSQKSQPDLAKAFTYNFANVIAIDPADHLHILLTFHEACLAPHPATCIVESMNGGDTWRIIDGEPTWNGNEGQVIFFLENSSTWLWGSQTNGFWRSPDSGKTWQAIPKMTTSHLQGSQILRTKAGKFFAAGADGIWTSTDGTVPTWKLVADTGPIVGGLVTDGTDMYASTCYFGGFCNPRYLHSAETDGQAWTALPNSPTLTQGGNLGYDKAHKLLYSSNLDAGLWRVVVP